ncbi:hypothetical protein CDEST_03257 [Colletotrichum destructivum]|uniref:Secreted protein n=1 Tax=Colletotrichum destructivum TaxID=34406 RepID=A0AAX4I4D2_9PEZI|nr:hypothetical protein CDEST_03257 [Colletotrichum destructivum]
MDRRWFACLSAIGWCTSLPRPSGNMIFEAMRNDQNQKRGGLLIERSVNQSLPKKMGSTRVDRRLPWIKLGSEEATEARWTNARSLPFYVGVPRKGGERTDSGVYSAFPDGTGVKREGATQGEEESKFARDRLSYMTCSSLFRPQKHEGDGFCLRILVQ